MWYAKMYFSEKKECFQYDPAGIQAHRQPTGSCRFWESLLSFLELDCGEITPVLQRIAENWSRLITEDDRQADTDAMMELGQLKSRHIYLEFLYARWYDRFSRMGVFSDRGSRRTSRCWRS